MLAHKHFLCFVDLGREIRRPSLVRMLLPARTYNRRRGTSVRSRVRPAHKPDRNPPGTSRQERCAENDAASSLASMVLKHSHRNIEPKRRLAPSSMPRSFVSYSATVIRSVALPSNSTNAKYRRRAEAHGTRSSLSGSLSGLKARQSREETEQKDLRAARWLTQGANLSEANLNAASLDNQSLIAA